MWCLYEHCYRMLQHDFHSMSIIECHGKAAAKNVSVIISFI